VFSESIHRYLFLFGIISLAFGMMMGTVPTSVPQFILLGNWLLEGNFKNKWINLKSNTLFWILSSVFLIHVLGLIHTYDLVAGIKDVKTKMPLMFLPIIFFSSKPLSLKEFQLFLYFFIAGSVANTAWCLIYTFVLHQNEVMRNASRFMSHIRLGLYLNLAIAACFYFIYVTQTKWKQLILVCVILYFIFVLYALGLATGIFNFMILFSLSLVVLIYRQKALIKIAGLGLLIVSLLSVTVYVKKINDTQLVVKQHENNAQKKHSPSGRDYLHFEENGQKENGYFIQINIQPLELKNEWKRRFPADSFNFDAKHNVQRYEVLVRYLASKGLTKDSLALTTLSEVDFQNIQKNYANYQYAGWSFLHKRIYELVNEYDEFKHDRYINGHSVTMRLYFWKAAIQTIKKNVLFGVGTGDVQNELNKTYVETHSPLHEEWYKRPHNQFLTITVALGAAGLLIFIFSLIYPILKFSKQLPVLFWPFILVAMGSFFMEDTLETQAGLSFFAVFNSLFVAKAYYENHQDTKSTEVH
jgi:hypothetical protein